MGQVRSALEIALEKTADIQGDKTGAQSRELKIEGKKAATAYLENREPKKLADVLSGKKDAERQFIREGALSIFLAAVRLPVAEDDLRKLADIGAGLDVLLPDSGIPSFFEQVVQIMQQYMEEAEQLGAMLEQQFMPRLKAKQQELEKMYGQAVSIDLRQDPEYMQALSRGRRMLEQKYDTVIEEIRRRILEIAGIVE